MLEKSLFFCFGHREKSDEGLESRSAPATAARTSQALGADLFSQLFLLLFLSVGEAGARDGERAVTVLPVPLPRPSQRRWHTLRVLPQP